MSLLLSAAVGGFVSLIWNVGAVAFSEIKELVLPQTISFTWWNALVVVAISIIYGFWAENTSAKKAISPTIYFLLVLFCASIVAARLWEISLMFIPISIAMVITLTLIHFKKLWRVDNELTEKLVQLASTGHLLEEKSADVRIESGLKLLETIMPLSEAIVFRRELTGELNPIGRSRNGNGNSSAIDRQSSWRESIELCTEAIETRKTVVAESKSGPGAARVALPLIYENISLGVLFVKVKHDFLSGDKALLEAFTDQLAQNLQRQELRQKRLPHHSWWSSFSTESVENRLGIISLVHGIVKEQSFSAYASSYLSEAHAIAYLDGTLSYLNRQMRQLANLSSPEESNEIDIFGLLDRFKTEVFNEPSLVIRRVLQSGEAYKGDLFFPETDRTLKMQISLVKVPDGNGAMHETNLPSKPACFLITFRDVSAIKENEKLRSDMASLMSHELRTPVTSIQGFAEILLADEDLKEDSREFLTIISNESQRLAKMLSTFLSVSNLEQSDKKEVSKTPVKLDSIVHEVVNDFQQTAKRKRIRLVEQANMHLPPVAADKGLISRAISNLIDNAIRYSPERTSVIISTILESDFLRVVVEDRGYGIHSSEHEKIWEKFYRVARDGQDKEEESIGLGLSLVREIIEQHGGKVEVESEVGRGSRFSVKLPRL